MKQHLSERGLVKGSNVSVIAFLSVKRSTRLPKNKGYDNNHMHNGLDEEEHGISFYFISKERTWGKLR